MTKNRKKAYQEQFRARVKEVDGAMTFLRGKMLNSKARARIRIERRINSVLHRQSGMARRMKQYRESLSDAWSTLKRGIGNAAEDIYAALQRARMKMR